MVLMYAPGYRLARVVTWLEGLAGDELDREEAAAHRTGGARVHFSEREGLPLETRDALQAQVQSIVGPNLRNEALKLIFEFFSSAGIKAEIGFSIELANWDWLQV